MPNLLDIFSGDAFSVVEMTDSIRSVPTQYGRLNEMGLFTPKGISTSVVSIEIYNGVLNLIPKTDRGTTGAKNKSGKRNMKFFETPRLALDDLILPSDIQNVREFGGEGLKTPQSVTNDKLVELSQKHDITHEFLKCGAITGKVYDASGDLIVDLYDEFGISEKSVDIDFAADGDDVNAKLMEVKRHIKAALRGDVMSYIHALCSPDYFDELLSNEDIKKAYAHYQEAQAAALGMAAATANPLRNDVRDGFVYKGILFEEYDGNATAINDEGAVVTKDFIPEGTARFFPVGTNSTFREYQAPADWMETVNTEGQNKYAKTVVEPGGRHVEVLSQSCPLPICLRPDVLVEGTLG